MKIPDKLRLMEAIRQRNENRIREWKKANTNTK